LIGTKLHEAGYFTKTSIEFNSSFLRLFRGFYSKAEILLRKVAKDGDQYSGAEFRNGRVEV
jgi:uncharacterized protein HemY